VLLNLLAKNTVICGMKVLIVAATEGEIAHTRKFLAGAGNHLDISLLLTGVGPIAATWALTNALQREKYDFVLQAGVGGSFDASVPLGSLVLVTIERYGDLGAEDNGDTLDIFDMGLMQPDLFPHTAGALLMPQLPDGITIALPPVKGITVSMVSGSAATIAWRSQKYHPVVESMEGAAFHFVCLQAGIPFAQVRAISNYVIPRDKSQWRMKDAVVALNEWLVGFVGRL
jgi:futalosine hydrolase